MTALIPFRNEEFELTVTPDGDSFRVHAPGLARALGFRQALDMTRTIPDSEKGYELVRTPGGEQRIGYVTEAGFYRCLGQRQAARIKDANVRAQVERFQSWVYGEVLPSIRRRGGYLTPEAAERAEHQLNAAIRRAQMQMELCQAAKGIIHPDHLEARARIVLARGLDERPVLDEARKPLYTQDFLREKNLSSKRLRSVAGVFGKRAKAAYIERYGVAPEKYHLNLPNGQVREVYGYTEADRPMLEAVWSAFESAPRLEVLA